eukprot:136038-Heterocapsa_arctica.AAC.1
MWNSSTGIPQGPSSTPRPLSGTPSSAACAGVRSSRPAPSIQAHVRRASQGSHGTTQSSDRPSDFSFSSLPVRLTARSMEL